MVVVVAKDADTTSTIAGYGKGLLRERKDTQVIGLLYRQFLQSLFSSK